MSSVAANSAAHDRARTRFLEHRQSFAANQPLRQLYGEWYGKITQNLPPPALGPVLELGSGPGLAADFMPSVLLTDVVRAPWHQMTVAAENLPFANGTLGAIVLFDVLHHLPSPLRFLREAVRALPTGGRLLICDPYISPFSFPVFKWLHEEGFDFTVDPFEPTWLPGKDPFAGNQAVATQLFFRRRAEFERRVPELAIVVRERLAGVSYPLAGGFARKPFVSETIWKALKRTETFLPAWAYAWFGFRTLVVLQRA